MHPDLRKNNNYPLLLIMIFFMYSCSDNVKTGFKEIDNQFKFINKIDTSFDSLPIKAVSYYLEKQSDSVYVVVNDDDNKISRGWAYNDVRIGDWYFENKSEEIDSIVNYINYNGMYNGNTIKYFSNGVLQIDKGYYYQFSYNAENIKKDEPVEIDMQLCYDKQKFVGSLQLFLFKDPQSITDYSDFLKWERDSVFSYGEDFYYLRVTPRSKGENIVQGYYTLIPRKNFDKEIVSVKPIFFTLFLNAK